jgi:hypothetical protein
MPRGPKGEKRPADVIGNAVHVMNIAVGEIDDAFAEKNPKAIAKGKLGGEKGGVARAKKLTSAERSKIAKKAAKARWGKNLHRPFI